MGEVATAHLSNMPFENSLDGTTDHQHCSRRRPSTSSYGSIGAVNDGAGPSMTGRQGTREGRASFSSSESYLDPSMAPAAKSMDANSSKDQRPGSSAHSTNGAPHERNIPSYSPQLSMTRPRTAGSEASSVKSSRSTPHGLVGLGYAADSLAMSATANASGERSSPV